VWPGKYGGCNPVEYFVRLRAICGICFLFLWCGRSGEGEEEEEELLKSFVIPHIQTLNYNSECI